MTNPLETKEVYVLADKRASMEGVRFPHSTLVPSRHVRLPPIAQASLPILSYCVASIVMTVTNKYVVSGSFNMVFLLLSIQSAVTITLLQAFKFFNLIKFREYKSEEAKRWFPTTIFLVAMIYTGSKALQFLPIPVYTIFKNLTIILIAYGEVLWFGGSVTGLMLISFTLMAISSAIAGWNDISQALISVAHAYNSQDPTVAMVGYLWMVSNCISSAAFVLYMRKCIKLTNFKDFDTVYYNNLLCIPILIVPSILFEGWSAENFAINFPHEQRHAMIWAIIFSGVSAFAMSYASAWCVRTTSSTTYSMVGSLNKLPIAISGIIFFSDPATFNNVAAIFIGFVAGVVYSYAKAFSSVKPTISFRPYSDASTTIAADSCEKK